MSQVETAFEELVIDQVVEQKNLIVFNDHVNSFDHVIESLVKVCKHDMIQAEQCTWLVHYKGKCQVKKGDYEELEEMCTGLLNRGITAEIQ